MLNLVSQMMHINKDGIEMELQLSQKCIVTCVFHQARLVSLTIVAMPSDSINDSILYNLDLNFT